MKKFIIAIVFLFISVCSFSQQILTATKVAKSRGAEIEYVLPDNMEEVPVDRPVLSRGGCIIKIDNWTGYYVDIWVDKKYRGRLNPWENSQMIMPEGFDAIYCQTIGGSYKWEAGGECNEQYVLSAEEDE